MGNPLTEADTPIIVGLNAEHKKDYTVWNAVNNAHKILDEAEEVSIETYREATFYLRKAIKTLEKKGKSV